MGDRIDLLDGIVTWAEIDLDAIGHNVRAFRSYIGEKVQFIAVVKANAYGHGAIQVARAALEFGASSLAVHRAIEGKELRNAGIQAPILVMGYTPPDGAELVVSQGLTPSLITWEFAQALSARAEAHGLEVPVHIKIDSGMSRYGLGPEDVVGMLQALSSMKRLKIEGLFTHLATADWQDTTYVREQLAIFNRVVEESRSAGFNIPVIHAANSAGTMRLREAHLDAVRVGIAMYGLHPSSEWSPTFGVHPALSMKSIVCRIRWLPKGAAIGYGRTFLTERPTLAALVPVGYGDGYHRALSNKGWVLVGGKRAPVLGRVSMDQIVVDVTTIPEVRQDDEVVLVGFQRGERITAEELAELAGTINYEITTGLLPRVARVYTRGSQVVEVVRIDD